MIKVTPNRALNMACIAASWLGEASFNGKVYNIGDLFLMKDRYDCMWVHVKIDKGRMFVEMSNPPDWLEFRNQPIADKLGSVSRKHFVCWIDFEEHKFHVVKNRVFSALRDNELKEVLGGMELHDFAESVLCGYFEKLLHGEVTQ